MAIVQNPITGRTRKAFGTAVFSKSYGNNTMRTKALDVKNPKTAGQMRQRGKFATIVDLVRQVLPLVNSVYAGLLTAMSPFNKITSLNLKNAFVGDPPELDHSLVVLCDLVGSTVENVTLTPQADQVMDIAWNPGTTNADELASLISLVFFNTDTNKAMIFEDVAARSVGAASVTFPVDWVGSPVVLHVVTTDAALVKAGKPGKIVKFKAGADLTKIVL